jgi:bifunctional N-acetylglucosamine-1-phosphate-uridyltransferase/glucosamine-1-phosphate-acetyltransferase GlmU-like protein
VSQYETYPQVDHSPVDHGVVVTRIAQNGVQEVAVFGPYTEKQAFAELAQFSRRGNVYVDVKNSLVLRVSDREVVVVHDSFMSKWTARAVVGTYIDGVS